ncbi:MAG: hypothetical protein M3P04_03355 [Actinomycetota bacterium]|nr:hypothetical protein [Actinomycetota bacterium]
MSTPELHRPPLYACAAGAVLHAHSNDTLEPAVILYTFLPTGAGDRLDALDARVDVHADGPGSGTLTLRVLSEGQSLSWQLPISPFVAALPGQPGDDGRMVLLGVMDAEPEEGFWARPVDCERLAAELQIPVTDLVEALHGRLTPWLADDVDLLLHDDAHEHAADRSPAQTLSNAVLAHYRGDLEAEQASTRLLRAFDLAPKDYMAELGARLCVALVTAVVAAGPEGVEKVLAETGPFEPEVARLLTELPPRMRPDDPSADDTEVATDIVLQAPDHGEAVKAAVTCIARLARTAFGEGIPTDELLKRLSMVDDTGELRLATMWLDLAVAASGPTDTDGIVASELAHRVHAEGAPAGAWLRATSATLAALALEATGRSTARVAAPVHVLDGFLSRRPRAGAATPVDEAAGAFEQCLELARFVRVRAGIGPGTWRQVPVSAAALAVARATAQGLDRSLAVDLLEQLLADDVDAVDLVEAVVCATAQLLLEVDPLEPEDSLRERVDRALTAVPDGNKGARWLLIAALREAPHHDQAATDLSPVLPREQIDVDRVAERVGRTGVLRAALQSLDAVAGLVPEIPGLPREEMLAMAWHGALVEHDMLLLEGGVE